MIRISSRYSPSLILIALLCGAARADDAGTRKMAALVRQGANLVQQEVTLTDLVSSDSFKGTYFTVVLGQADQPVPFNAPADLALKAATVYYAFTHSRAYFVQTLQSLLPTLSSAQRGYLDEPMVIRLEMTHPFSAEIHYDLSQTVFNGAVTVPASDDFREDGTPPWGAETWFFAAQTQTVGNPASQLPGVLNSSDFKLAIFESLAQQDALGAIQDVQTHLFSVTSLSENVAISLGLAQGLPPLLSKVIQIIPGKVYLDAALIPEIGANEYAHYALSPWLGMKRRFHVGEGYAHYFASKITGLVRLQDKAGKYSRGYSPIRGDSSDMYDFMKEVGPSAAMSSFTFSVLSDLEKALKADGPAVIAGTLLYLDSGSSLKMDFTRAVFSSIADLGTEEKKDMTTDAYWAHSVLSNRGM